SESIQYTVDGGGAGNPNNSFAIGVVDLSPAETDTYQVMSFVPSPNGEGPRAGLIQGSDGNFYGTTSSGGAFGRGTVFKMNASGTLTMLHSFAGSDGENPYAGLIQDSNGKRYSTTPF